MRYALVLIVAAVSGCASMPSVKFWPSGPEFEAHEVDVQELRRALLCGTETEDAQVTLFDDLASLQAWPGVADLQLERVTLPADAAFVLVEQGQRTTSGYTIELASTASVTDAGTLELKAEFVEPSPDRITAEITTTLCVLASIPREPFLEVTVTDGAGVIRARQSIGRD